MGRILKHTDDMRIHAHHTGRNEKKGGHNSDFPNSCEKKHTHEPSKRAHTRIQDMSRSVA